MHTGHAPEKCFAGSRFVLVYRQIRAAFLDPMALSQNFRGIAAILVATGSFVANDTCMKLALEDAPPFQVLVMRGIAAILWCLPVIYGLGLIRELPKAFNPWVLLRSLSELIAILCFITALAACRLRM